MRSIKAISSRTNESSCSSLVLQPPAKIEKCLFRVGHYTIALGLLLSDADHLLTRGGTRDEVVSRGPSVRQCEPQMARNRHRTPTSNAWPIREEAVKHLLSSAMFLALVFGNPSGARAQTEITLIAPGGIRTSIEKLIPGFEQKTGYKVKATFGSGGGTKKQVVQGDA